jgi:hypothetical protein
VPQLAAAPGGRIWVGWMDPSGNVLLRRSNQAGTSWGAPVKVRPPKGTVEGFALNLSAQAGTVDILARFGSLNTVNVFHTQARPGLTFDASPKSFSHTGKHTIHFRVLDAGDPVKGVRITLDGMTARTNGQGEASLDVGPFAKARTLVARASISGYASASVRLRAH